MTFFLTPHNLRLKIENFEFSNFLNLKKKRLFLTFSALDVSAFQHYNTMRYYEAMITVILLLFVELLTLCTANDVSPGVIKFTRLYVDHEGLTRLRHCTYCLIS